MNNPLYHLGKSIELCLESHRNDLDKDIQDRIKCFDIRISPSEDSIIINVYCEDGVKQIVQDEIIDKCYILKSLTLQHEVRFN